MIGLLLVIVLYAFAQPWLNKRLGWNLPAIPIADSSSSPSSNSSPSQPPVDSSLDAKPSSADSSHADSATAESFLQKVGDQTFRSPAGLVYKRGSAEGHRLKHLERHLRDIPDRPGPHGVFNGTMDEFLRIIDAGYTRAKNKESGTSVKNDNGREEIDIRFPSEIGFLGGQEGKRKGNPPLKRLKIILDEDSVITAYPF
ncbi:MAG: hypothetical protein MUD03_09630 [Pirellula sp.]|nr:hypothetical protein [Pirellula sp.]